MSVVSLPSVIGECMYDDDVLFVERGLFDCIECL